jgi:predicted RNase H-like HicB family nuclease
MIACTLMSVSDAVTFTAIYETVENGWVQARLVEIPGVITAGATRDEAEAMLVDALREYLLSFAEPPQPIESSGRRTSGHVDITITTAA